MARIASDFAKKWSPDDFRRDNIVGSHGKRGLLRCPKIDPILNLELDELNEAHQEAQKLG